MRFKLLLFTIIIAACTVATGFAATYYVTPDGAGDKTGANWDNAFGTAELVAKVASTDAPVENGDIFYFAAGTYKPTTALSFPSGVGAYLYGNSDGEGRTVFSGDVNGDDVASEGDLATLVSIKVAKALDVTDYPAVVKDIDFTCVYTNVANSSDDDQPAALSFGNTPVATVENCTFTNTKSVGAGGGAAFTANRSTVTLKNCVFDSNTTNARGVIRLCLSGTNYDKGVTNFVNCRFSNNSNTGDGLGGVIAGLYTNSINLVNCTFYKNTSTSSGAAIYINASNSSAQKNYLRVVGCTFANNTITGDAGGEQICSKAGFNFKLVNNIFVNPQGSNTVAFQHYGATDVITTGGYNYIDNVTVADGVDALTWAETDKVGEANTYASIFGENVLGDNGVIAPTQNVVGATGGQTATAIAEWGLPEGVDVTVDQLGESRNPETGMCVTPGAYAKTFADPTTGIADIATDGDEAAARYYDLRGARVATPAGGLYIRVSGGKASKVLIP